MIWSLWTVTASTMITRFEMWRKVRCHSGAVEKICGHTSENLRINPNGWDI
jgi:hypothetical protein